jgi:hypothetical protein
MAAAHDPAAANEVIMTVLFTSCVLPCGERRSARELEVYLATASLSRLTGLLLSTIKCCAAESGVSP